MLEIGLTGGIGSGKSSVSQRLAERGAVVIDADAIVRELQQPGEPVFVAMVDAYGPKIVRCDGSLDRAAVAAIVFSDAEELDRLNAIVHPVLNVEITKRRETLAESDATVILDLPLLVESGHSGFAAIIVVDVDPAVAVERLVTFRGFSRADAQARIANQVDRAQRLAVADFVIDNNGDLVQLDAEVDRCWEWIESLERPVPGQPITPTRGVPGRPGTSA